MYFQLFCFYVFNFIAYSILLQSSIECFAYLNLYEHFNARIFKFAPKKTPHCDFSLADQPLLFNLFFDGCSSFANIFDKYLFVKMLQKIFGIWSQAMVALNCSTSSMNASSWGRRMTQITKTQVFSQIVDQKEHKNNWYKFGGSTSRFQYHPTSTPSA